jgi:hypothetical protein
MEASIPPTTEASDIDVGNCHAPGIDGDSQEFRDLITSKEYRSKADQIKEDSQQQIKKLKEELNRRVMTEIQSMEAIESASGYKEDGILLSSGNLNRLFYSYDRPESLGALYLRRLNYDENEQMKSTKIINDYFLANIPDLTKDLYEKYGIEPSFGHFKSVEDYIHNHMSMELVKVDENAEGEFHMINGKKYEYVITAYDAEKMPEGVNLEFIREFLIHSNEHLTLYDDITNNVLWGDYRKSCYYEENEVYFAQKSFDYYCSNIGEPYGSQAKEVKERIDSLQDDYMKQVEQIVDSSMKKIAGIQADALKGA